MREREREGEKKREVLLLLLKEFSVPLCHTNPKGIITRKLT